METKMKKSLRITALLVMIAVMFTMYAENVSYSKSCYGYKWEIGKLAVYATVYIKAYNNYSNGKMTKSDFVSKADDIADDIADVVSEVRTSTPCYDEDGTYRKRKEMILNWGGGAVIAIRAHEMITLFSED
jgi:hypothetical protein